ncbi:phosphate ABC transporter substrate-binding protein [Solimonas marina]|uniref:Phosphate ABC transporter substrate-binding protein n=1 Tax=Solimonas marina TaxID=2714601 RepID=A0A969WB67_9GAMM|nr:phosphate ABC transporter substrate-binding protein [Solimonas marina]NKF24146.1 phosphate ABC transporter substrate-binding protein [Solimonas marina]
MSHGDMEKIETARLSAMMGSYPKTAPLKDATLTSPLLRLDFAPIEVAQKGFKDVVRGVKFDVAELAIITFLQAFEAGKPYRLLPFVMNGGFHHKSIVCRSDDSLAPSQLAGKRVAMRAYTQTTPTWVRGILCDDYGVSLPDVRWLNQEGAHVEGYEEPQWVTRIESQLSLEQMLRAGEVDAIIAGGGLSGGPGIRPLIDNPREAALEWHRRTGVVPINHVVTIRAEIAEQRPDLVREVYRLLIDARKASGQMAPGDGPDLQPFGFEPMRASLEMAVRYAHEQKLISRRYALDELYGSVAAALA